jgi:hypothetical protein
MDQLFCTRFGAKNYLHVSEKNRIALYGAVEEQKHERNCKTCNQSAAR